MKRGISKKGQVAIEFLILTTLAFTMFMIYVGLTSSRYSELVSEEEYLLLKDTGDKVREEIMIASRVNEGYYRQFDIPVLLGDSFEYNVTGVGDILIFNSLNHEYTVTVPTYNGTVVVGTNSVNKSGGVIYINQ